MISCVRRLQFCAGHRVVNHESKCRNLHGHNYVAFIHARSRQLDEIGRVIDFSVLKEKVGGWIDEHWDHGLVMWAQDPICDDVVMAADQLEFDQKHYLIPTNPTAENMADFLLRRICPEVLAGSEVEVFRVVLWETENCYAEASL